MSIDTNAGRAAPETSLSKSAENTLLEDLRASEEEARLADAIDAIKGEFSDVASGISGLE